MSPIATSVGALLCIVGAIYFGIAPADHRSPTALIPLFIGFPIAVLGILARKEKMRKHAMHGAAGLALLGLLGSLRFVKSWIGMMQGVPPANPLAAQEGLILFVTCLIFLVLCIRSFVAARKAQAA
jgi:hypothetical protein